MNINTINSTSKHLKSTVEQLRSVNQLPFTEVLSIASINEKLNGVAYRDRIFTPDLTVFGFLSQVLGADQSCQAAVTQVIAHLVAQGKEAPSANTAAYCQARARLPLELLSSLAKESAKNLEAQSNPEWLWRNRPVKMPDGTTVSMSDTLENQAMYPQHASQKKGVGFPIARLVGVFVLGTGGLLDLAIAPWSGKETGEHALLRQLMHVFEAGDVVLGDAYYASFFLIAFLLNKQIDCVFQMHGGRNTDFRRGKRLGKKDHLVEWKKPAKPEWMDEETYAEYPSTITVRETTLEDLRAGHRSRTRVVVTTLVNRKEVMPKDLAELYGYRWFVELNLRSIKEVMHMDILRGKTPKMVHKEIWAHVLAYNLISRWREIRAY